MESLKEIIDQVGQIVPIVVMVGAAVYIAHRLQKRIWRPQSLSYGMDILVRKEYNQLSELKVNRPLLVMSYKDEYNKNKDIYYCEHPKKRFLLKKIIGFRAPTIEERVEIQNRVKEAKKVYKEGPEKFKEYVAKHYLKA